MQSKKLMTCTPHTLSIVLLAAASFGSIQLGLPLQACASESVSQNTEPVSDATSDSALPVNRHNVTIKPSTQKEREANSATAKAVNRLPGVHVEDKDLQPPTVEKPIHGFHPIKKMLQPVVQLEKNSVQLQQQIMKLEGPIAGLQPAMFGLQKKMGGMEQKMGTVQTRIDNVGTSIKDVGSRVQNVGGQMNGISEQMTAVRADITGVRKEIGQLSGPIKDLHKPLAEVAQPLQTVDQKLEKLAALLTTVLFAILLAAGIIAIGTPIAAIMIYKNRRKLFPDMSDREFPVAKAGESQSTLHPTKT